MKRSTTFVIAAVAALGLGAVALPVIAQQTQMPFGNMMGGMGMHGAMGANMGMMGGGMMGGGMMGADQHMAAFDTNADGTLSAEEIAAGIKAELAKYDTDANGTLSLDEFAAMQADMQAQALRTMAVRAFQMHDADGDGQVTEAEMAALATQMQQMHTQLGAMQGGMGGMGQMGGMPHDGMGAMQGMMGN